MDDRISQAIALLIGTLSSVVLMWANFRWGGRRMKDEIHDHDTNEEDNDA